MPDLNVGKVHNEGFEVTVKLNSNETKKIQYFVEVSTWYARNKIVYNSESTPQFSYLSRTGRMINQPFLLEAIGFFKDPDDINNSPRQIFTTVQPGDIKYKDQNGDNIIDQNDYYPSGYSQLPQITCGFNTGLKYQGFDLDAFFQGVTNRSVYWGGNYFYAFQNNGKISSIALGRWTPETASTATYPRLSANNNLNNFQPSTFWQHDGSYIKLRSLELGYSLPKKMIDKIKLASARIFINGTNLFSLDHMNKFTDPEILTGYPALKTYSLGIKIQL
jgi:hypothetical protein